MKYSFGYFLILFINISCQPESEFHLPDTWTREFKIIIYSDPGMKDEAVEITYTYDSCKYVKREGTVKKTSVFALTELQRDEILRRLLELKLDKIKSIPDQKEIVLDEGSSGICFYNKKEFCLDGGTSTKFNEQDNKNYNIAYTYLWEIAVPKK